MSCLDELPNNIEPNYECASELLATGPVAALIIFVIGIPLIKLAKRQLRKLFDKTEFD